MKLVVVPATRKLMTGSGLRVLGSVFWVKRGWKVYPSSGGFTRLPEAGLFGLGDWKTEEG